MFDAILEQETATQPARAGILSMWQVPLLVCGLLPPVASAYSTRNVINVFGGMARAGVGGVGAVSMGLYESNRPLAIALAITTVALLIIAAVQLRAGANAISGSGYAMCVVLGAASLAPPLLLWAAESLTIVVIGPDTHQPIGSIGEVSARLSRLLIASSILGLVVPVLSVAGATVAHFALRAGPAPRSRLLPVSWLVLALAFAVVAGAFIERTVGFHEAAMTGSLRPVL